jgi:hypothetical protein
MILFFAAGFAAAKLFSESGGIEKIKKRQRKKPKKSKQPQKKWRGVLLMKQKKIPAEN